MSELDLSESNPPEEFEKPTEKMTSTGIGARIMRRLRQNTTVASKEKTELKKKSLNPNSKSIEKLYLNKSLGRVKYTQLETIFEHEDETDSNENVKIDGKKLFGKKNKRTAALRDGLNASKTLKEKRKRRIKNFFGVHKKFKRMSMKNFLERLQSTDTVEVVAPPLLPEHIQWFPIAIDTAILSLWHLSYTSITHLFSFSTKFLDY